jgi:glycerol kinase
MGPTHCLAIDQGTTSSRAFVVDGEGRLVGTAQRELTQHYPRSGWVEHDPEAIWRDTLAVARGAIDSAGLDAAAIAGIGITNQRETTVIWDRATGEPVHNAIVWQDRRGAPLCDRLKRDGHEPLIQRRTGLLADAYFSATKIAWLLDNVDGLRERAARGKLAFGTIDSFLLWRFTGGGVHATDATNAARTMLYDIRRQRWDDELLALLDIPRALLPEVRASDAWFGETDASLFGRPIPVAGMVGDQQAATVGQACLDTGMLKSTYGTGCFALLNTGEAAPTSRNQLLTTIAYRLGERTVYALEGSIFVAGAAVQWLRDGLGLVTTAAETEDLARRADPESGVYMVPAFVGLGAPYWDAGARGAILGLTRAAGPPEIAAATLDAVAYQTRDLMEAMAADRAHVRDGGATRALRVDGGMVANDWFLQRLADLLGLPVERPEVTETTALGAACLAGMTTGVIDGEAGIAAIWRRNARFDPQMPARRREQHYAGWVDAVKRVQTDGG